MAKILIPTPLRQYVDRKDSLDMEGKTVGEVLGTLTSAYQDLRRQLYSDEGKLRNFVNVYVNDEDIRYLGKENTPVKPEDTISIVPSIAGGGSHGG
jgi:molybdopterin converting factor small subunit